MLMHQRSVPVTGGRCPDQHGWTGPTDAVVWRVAGLLLDYPYAETLAATGALAAETRRLPAPAGPALHAYLDSIMLVPAATLARWHAEVFGRSGALRVDGAERVPELLQRAGTSDVAAGRLMLTDHQPLLEALRHGLRAIGAPHAPLLEAVLSTLPHQIVTQPRAACA